MWWGMYEGRGWCGGGCMRGGVGVVGECMRGRGWCGGGMYEGRGWCGGVNV